MTTPTDKTKQGSDNAAYAASWLDLLENISKPARYIGGEFNSRNKDFDAARVRFVLGFPDVYEVGFSHLGLRLLYHLLNDMEGVLADRVYTPWLDFEQRLREYREPLRGLETGRPLNRFDFVGISLQYELSYTNIFTLLDLGGIPIRSRDRRKDDPWVIGGGPCAYNPEPLAELFDFVVIGEAEEVLRELIPVFKQWRASGTGRQEFLETIRHIGGIYIPSFFRVRYLISGRIEAIEPLYEDYPSVVKRLVTDLDSVSPLPERPLVPLVDVVHNRLGVEITRGCTRGCRFCQAGYIYRPARERRPQKVLEHTAEALTASGYEELSFLSLSAGDYCQIQDLLAAFMAQFGECNVAVSLPSMRVGTLTPELMELVKRVRKTGFTLAPEAGSERLRRVINKDISDSDLLDTAAHAFDLGWRLIKLYFMSGLPTETEEDIGALIQLCFKVWRLAKPFRASVNVSVSTFVPKPMTPFQWVGQVPRGEIEERLEGLKRRLKRPGMRLKWHDPGQSFLEAVFARGDRRLFVVLEEAWRSGARFDGWTEQFQLELWEEVFDRFGIDPRFYAERTFAPDEVLPWDHLSAGVEKKFLWNEYQRGLGERYTPDCRWDHCSACGVCDHEEVAPVIHDRATLLPERLEQNRGRPRTEKVLFYRLQYTKLGKARYLGQLELNRCFARALRRAQLPVVFSKGFHPHVRLSFEGALPLGLESEVEEVTIALRTDVDPQIVKDRLNQQLPTGVIIRKVERVAKKLAKPAVRRVSYRVSGLTPLVVRTIIKNYANRLDEFLVKKTKRGEKTAKLKDVVMEVRPLDASTLKIDLCEKADIEFRPRAVLEFLLEDEAGKITGCRIVKTAVMPVEGYQDVRRTDH